MGTFNILIVDARCVYCNRFFEHRVQFKFAERWQYEYNVGDKVKRGDPYYDIGKPDLPKVRVDGCLENSFCPHCSFENPDDCDVVIENDTIIGIAPHSGFDKFGDDNFYEDK